MRTQLSRLGLAFSLIGFVGLLPQCSDDDQLPGSGGGAGGGAGSGGAVQPGAGHSGVAGTHNEAAGEAGMHNEAAGEAGKVGDGVQQARADTLALRARAAH
jgi:hypothetical protein